MKKILQVLLIILVLSFSLQSFAVTKIIGFTLLTGNTTGSLDKISSINDGDMAIGVVNGTLYAYKYNSTSIETTNAPLRIQPASGTGCWEMASNNGEIDALYFGATYTDTTLMAACTAIGSNTTTILVRPGTWTQSANRDYTAVCPNVTFKFASSAVISQGAFTLKLPNSVIYPEWFGCLADDSTDNTAALQNAINAAPAGAVVKVPFGISRFTNLTIDTVNVTLEGDGWGSVLSTTMAADSDTAPALWVKASGVNLKNFKITWATIPSAEQYGTSVEKNDTIAIGTIAYGPPAPAQLSNVVIDGVYVYGGKQHGISLGNTTGAKIINNRVEEVYGTGIWPYNSDNLHVTDNDIYRTADAGIDVTSDLVTYSSDVIISNNLVEKTAVGIGSHGGRGVTISDNIIDNTWASAIYCQESAFYGIPAPFITSITGNVIRKPFQFYGAGNFHTLDKYTTTAGTYNIIEVYSASEVNIANNIIVDDADLHNYQIMGVSGNHLSITGNIINSTAAVGIVIAYGTADDYLDTKFLSITGNTIQLADGSSAQFMLSLAGVNGGVITGNHFSCGGLGLTDPLGRFLVASWTKDLLVTGNRIEDCTTPYTSVGNTSNIILTKNMGVADYQQDLIFQAIASDVTGTAGSTPATLTIAQLLVGEVFSQHTVGATKTYNLPTAADISAGMTILANQAFNWTFINASTAATDTVTIAANTNHTFWGNPVIESLHATTGGAVGHTYSASFRTQMLTDGTFRTVRLN